MCAPGPLPLQDWFQQRYEWDLLSVRGLWAFGPDVQGPNVLLDDSLSTETDKNLLNAVRDSVIQVRAVHTYIGMLHKLHLAGMRPACKVLGTRLTGLGIAAFASRSSQ